MAPTVLRQEGYQFILFTSDHPPAHVHVRASGHLAKVRLAPIIVERAGGFSASELSKIIRIIAENQQQLLDEWDKYYASR